MGLRVNESGHDLVVKTGMPGTSILLLACAGTTVLSAAYRYVRSQTSSEVVWSAALIVSFVLIAAWLFGESAEFYLSRNENCFQWSRRRLLQKATGSEPLGAVIKARRDVLSDSEGDSYRLLIVTTDGDIPFTKAFGANGEELSLVSDRINRFVTASSNE